MRFPFRVLLPASLSLVSLGLMVWDVLAERACVWCETGLPVWPYRAPFLFLKSINAPAFVLATPFLLLPHLQSEIARHVVLLPVIALWWWWIGSRLDFGIVSWGARRFPKFRVTALVAMAATLVYVGARIVADEIERWLTYGPIHVLLVLSSAALCLWALALAAGCLWSALGILRGRFRPQPATGRGRTVLAYGFAFTALVAVTTSLIGYAREPKIDWDSCVASAHLGCLHGTIGDSTGKPLKGIEVEVLPTNKTGEARWYAKKSEWTEKKGRYRINELEPGEYLVTVHYYGAPDARQPFATTFYPGVEAEDRAMRVSVVPNSLTLLNLLRLRTLPLATLKVSVQWPDGTRPARSNLLFHNRSYPDQAVIGDEAPQIDDGIGEFMLPAGFEYLAQASVQCDGDRTIETRESRPVQEIAIQAGMTPRELTFTIPGPPCRLWEPK